LVFRDPPNHHEADYKKSYEKIKTSYINERCSMIAQIIDLAEQNKALQTKVEKYGNIIISQSAKL
jgi:primosomal protein N''